MGEQQSQKRGVESDSQKKANTRNEYDSVPATGPAGGAGGRHAPDRQSDQDAALGIDSGRREQRRKPWNERERSEDV